jgi:hypothetical protein
MTGKTAFFQGFCLQSYLDGLKMEALNASHVSFDLTHPQLPHRIGPQLRWQGDFLMASTTSELGAEKQS